jgi:hypothetical protein
MKTKRNILTTALSALIHLSAPAQANEPDTLAHLTYSGQLSTWAQASPDIPVEGWLGGRYIPQLNARIPLGQERQIDFEASANLFGDMGFSPFDSLAASGKAKAYRAWLRYSSRRVELRLGLQKINFGSARMFRPLMWFDALDPRDPLQLTDGVWGALGRYYFQNNANLWLWGLYANNKAKGWEILPTKKQRLEAGGRLQLPLPRGETALSYHHRTVEADAAPTGESRLGFDLRMDVAVGLWLEASWTHLDKDLGLLTNQEMITLGSDYTFPLGNGLTATYEQLLYAGDRQAFRLSQKTTFSGLTLTYPLSLLDNLSAITYYDWESRHPYIFLHWQRQWDHLSLYLMAYWNPATYSLPAQGASTNRFTGRGLQLMLVWNH